MLYMKLFDKNGNLIFHISHDSENDVYLSKPTIRQSLDGSINDMFKNIGKLNKTEDK